MEVVAEVEVGGRYRNGGGGVMVEEEVVIEEEEAVEVEEEVVVVKEVMVVVVEEEEAKKVEEVVVWFSDRSSLVAQTGLELTSSYAAHAGRKLIVILLPLSAETMGMRHCVQLDACVLKSQMYMFYYSSAPTRTLSNVTQHE